VIDVTNSEPSRGHWEHGRLGGEPDDRLVVQPLDRPASVMWSYGHSAMRSSRDANTPNATDAVTPVGSCSAAQFLG
jgi:hypothetical protein